MDKAPFRWLGLQTTTEKKGGDKIHKFQTPSTNHAHGQYANCAKKLFTLWPRPGSSAACLFFDCCTLTDEKPSGQTARLALSDLDATLPLLFLKSGFSSKLRHLMIAPASEGILSSLFSLC
jgi:hypothetical protein